MKKFIVIPILLSVLSLPAQRLITEEEAIRLALDNSPEVQAARLAVLQSEKHENSAVNIPNPEVMAESPTGEFYTIGVQQSMDFPTVYFQQRKLATEKTLLAQQEQVLSQSESTYRIRLIYLQAQYLQSLQALLWIQDSLYAAISESADAQYNAGSIDVIEKSNADLQYNKVHALYMDTEADYAAALIQLQLYTGIAETVTVTKLVKLPALPQRGLLVTDSAMLARNIRLKYFAQQERISKQSLRIERHRMLPGITFGYMNQGPFNTPVIYKFRAGITVPIWFWQYSGSTRAAKFQVLISQQQRNAQQQKLTSELIAAQSSVYKTLQNLTYYENSALSNANVVIRASTEYFAAGETDYINHLRNMNDAYETFRGHLDAIRNYNQAVIHLSYLNGN